jgi:hypothetical protein
MKKEKDKNKIIFKITSKLLAVPPPCTLKTIHRKRNCTATRLIKKTVLDGTGYKTNVAVLCPYCQVHGCVGHVIQFILLMKLQKNKELGKFT